MEASKKGDSVVSQLSHEEVDKRLGNQKKFLTSFVSGAVAGAIAKTTIAPLDRAKIVFQTSENRFNLRALWRFLFNSASQDGLRSLWRGNSATITRIVPYAAVQFSSHEQYKLLLHVDTHQPSPFSSSTVHIRRFMAGSLAGVTSVALTYPLDLVRARMAVTRKLRYRSLHHAFRSILKEEGVRTLFRGFSPTMLGSIPYSGTSFFTYETLKKALANRTGRNQPSPPERMLCGAIAGLLGQTASYPLDIARRRMQTGGVTGHPEYTRSIWSTLVLVYRTEGVIHGLFKGLSVNWVKGPIAVGISFTTFDHIRNFLRSLPWLHDSECDR